MPSRITVALDGLCDFLAVGFHIQPGFFEVEDAESGLVLEELKIAHSRAVRFLQHPDCDARHSHAGFAATNSGRTMDPARSTEIRRGTRPRLDE